jgi:hypothetical protein
MPAGKGNEVMRYAQAPGEDPNEVLVGLIILAHGSDLCE